MIFQFKQFAVDQTGCAMKINTDGVLLGATAEFPDAKQILDIGTGTGVIALMLAQRFPKATIDAVEIDTLAAATAGSNFAASRFANRLTCYPLGFEDFFDSQLGNKYDLIVSNPPFYLNSLKSPEAGKAIAKHTDADFFLRLMTNSAAHLSERGMLWLILPLPAAEIVKQIGNSVNLHLTKSIEISSYADTEPHRVIVAFSFAEAYLNTGKLTIYQQPKIYTEQYKALLKDFFTIF